RLWLPQVLQPVAAQAVERDARLEPWRHECPDRVGDHDLATMRRGRDACRAVDVEADEPRRRARCLTCVEAYPDLDLDTRRPGLDGERLLGLNGGGDRLDRPVEHHEERVALGALLVPAVSRERGAQERPVTLEPG